MIETAVSAAVKAGEAILAIYAQDFEVEFKADESPLTTADKAAHQIIVQELEATPYPVLSEESAAIEYDGRRRWETYWLVDPLDGTKEFIKKNGEFTVNIALIQRGVPILGVVYVPVSQTLYTGLAQDEAGMAQGAWKAGSCAGKSVASILASAERCQVSGAPAGPLKVVASKSHCNEETKRFIAELEEVCGAVELVSRGSSLKLCMVAEGSADVYPRIAPTMEWDTAAAHAVVNAAGGKVFKFGAEMKATAYHTTNNDVDEIAYNKPDLLNTYFVVSGLHEYFA